VNEGQGPLKEFGKNGGITPLQVLNLARQQVPIVNYALGLAGFSAAGAIISFFVGLNKAGLLLVALVFIGTVLLFAFARLAVSKSRSIQVGGLVLLWAVLLFFISFLMFTVTAFATGWPPAWAIVLGITPPSPVPPEQNDQHTDKCAMLNSPICRDLCQNRAIYTTAPNEATATQVLQQVRGLVNAEEERRYAENLFSKRLWKDTVKESYRIADTKCR